MHVKTRIDKKGFTLIEIIVVLTILAILAGILIPSMVGWIDKADEKACMAEMGGIRRGYQAEAAALAYDVPAGKEADLLHAATHEWSGADTTLSCGGTVSAVYDADRTYITSISCSKHGTLGAPSVSDGILAIWDKTFTVPGTTITSSLMTYFEGKKGETRVVDSLGPNYGEPASKLLKELGIDTDNMAWRIWRDKPDPNGTIFTVTWTPTDITKEDVDAVVPCTKKTLKYKDGVFTEVSTETGTAKVKKPVGKDFNTIDAEHFIPS